VKHNDGLPDGMTPIDHCVGLVMRNQFGRCVALEGRPGVEVSCKIYEDRPVVCRAMKKGTLACHGMRALSHLAEP
jgi:Fe-S-cluster containining protein